MKKASNRTSKVGNGVGTVHLMERDEQNWKRMSAFDHTNNGKMAMVDLFVDDNAKIHRDGKNEDERNKTKLPYFM
jgi:hypothetical protein